MVSGRSTLPSVAAAGRRLLELRRFPTYWGSKDLLGYLLRHPVLAAGNLVHVNAAESAGRAAEASRAAETIEPRRSVPRQRPAARLGPGHGTGPRLLRQHEGPRGR